MSLSDYREFEMLLKDSSRITYFLDFLMDHGAQNLLMFWLEAEQYAEFTGDASACYEQARALVDRYIGFEPRPDEESVDYTNRPRSTITLSREIRNKLREAVCGSPLQSTHNNEEIGNGDDEEEIDTNGYFPFIGIMPEDEEEIYVAGAAVIGFKPQSPEEKQSILTRMKCASCDLFTDAQAMVAVQLYRDWYVKFKQSSSYKRLCEMLTGATQKSLEATRINVEVQLDTSIATRRVVEAYLDSSNQRLGLVLRDQLNKPVSGFHSEEHSLYEAIERARATLNPFHGESAVARTATSVPITQWGASPQKSFRAKESWAGVVECLETLETLHNACIARVDVDSAIKKVSGLKTCQAFLSVREDATTFLSSQQRLRTEMKQRSRATSRETSLRGSEESGSLERGLLRLKGNSFLEPDSPRLQQLRNGRSLRDQKSLPGNLSKIGGTLTREQEDTFKRLARTRRFLPKNRSGESSFEPKVHPKIRWKRAYRKVRMMLLFSSDFADLFEVRRESHRMGMNLVHDSLEDYLTVHEDSGIEPSYEGWITELHPDNVKQSYVSEYDLGESDDDDDEIHGNSKSDLQKVSHHRRHDLCCVDFRFYSPESDHLKMWNNHPRVPEPLKIVISIEEAEVSTISEVLDDTKGRALSDDSDYGVDEDVEEWSSDEELAVSGDNLKAFDLRASALRLLKAYVAVLDVVKTDCSCWVNEVVWPAFLRSSFKMTLASALAACSSSTLKHRLGDLHRCRQCRLKYIPQEEADVWSECVEEVSQDRHMHNHHTAAISKPQNKDIVFSVDRFPSTKVKNSKENIKHSEENVEAWVVDSEVLIEMVDGEKSRLIKNSRRGTMIGVMNVDKSVQNGSFIFRRKVVSCRPINLTFAVRHENRMIVTLQATEFEDSDTKHLTNEVLQRVQDATLPLFCGAVHKTGGEAEQLRPTLQSFMTGEDTDMTELGACRTDWTKTTCAGQVVHLPKTRSVFTVNMNCESEGKGVPYMRLAALDLIRSMLIIPNRFDMPCDAMESTETDPRSQDLRILCEALSPKSLLQALTAVVLERPVILRSRSMSTLALATFALSRLADESLGLDLGASTMDETPPRRLLCPLLPFSKLQDFRKKRYHTVSNLSSSSSSTSPHLRPCLIGIDSRVLEAAELIELRDGAHAPLSPLASDQGSMLKGTRVHGDVRWAWATGGSLENLEGTMVGLRGLLLGAVMVDLDADFVDTSNAESLPSFPRVVTDKFERALHQAWHRRDIRKTSSLIFEPQADWRDRPLNLLADESQPGYATLLLCRQLMFTQCLLPLRRFTRRFPNEKVVLLQRRLMLECLDAASPGKRVCKANLEKIESMPLTPVSPSPVRGGRGAEASLAAEIAAAQALSDMVKEADKAMRLADVAVAHRWSFLRAFTLSSGCERVLPLLVESLNIPAVFESRQIRQRK